MHPKNRFRALVATVCLAAMLSGCGGGGNTRMDGDTGMIGGTGMRDGNSNADSRLPDWPVNPQVVESSGAPNVGPKPEGPTGGSHVMTKTPKSAGLIAGHAIGCILSLDGSGDNESCPFQLQTVISHLGINFVQERGVYLISDQGVEDEVYWQGYTGYMASGTEIWTNRRFNTNNEWLAVGVNHGDYEFLSPEYADVTGQIFGSNGWIGYRKQQLSHGRRRYTWKID